jgi:hypothetical protein
VLIDIQIPKLTQKQKETLLAVNVGFTGFRINFTHHVTGTVKEFFRHRLQTGIEDHPAYCPMGTVGYSWVKRPRHVADHSYSAED